MKKGIEEMVGGAIDYILTADNQREAYMEVSRQMQKHGAKVYLHFVCQYMKALDLIREACL